MKQHQSRHNRVPAQPEGKQQEECLVAQQRQSMGSIANAWYLELFEAVKASLRAKVAALAEDNWMYEKEEEPRLV